MDNNTFLTGSICLSDIPREVMKKVMCKDGKERIYVNISVFARKTPATFTNGDITRTYTHSISCAPKKEERREGVNYYICDLESRTFGPAAPAVTPEAVSLAPAVGPETDLPF